MVTNAATTASAPTVTLPRAELAAQIQALGLPRNSLSALFDLGMDGTAAASLPGLGAQEEAILQIALPLIASPALVARTRAVLGEERYLATWIMTGSSNDPAQMPYLLLAEHGAAERLEIRPVLNRDTIARSFMPYLDAGLPATARDAFELPVEAFVLLLALCDLHRRARFSGGLDHGPSPQRFASQDIELALADAREHADPRWLLPHLLAIRPDLPALPDLGPWLKLLASSGWITRTRGAVSWSEAGLRLAQGLDQRLAMLTFWVVAATERGDLASRASMLIRSPWHIWVFDVGGDDGSTAVGGQVDVASAYGLLQDLLTPVGVPLPVEMPAAAPRQAKARGPKVQRETVSKPAAAPEAKRARAGRRGAAQEVVPRQLVIHEGGAPARVFPLNGQATIGRSAENTIQLSDEQASRKHARIYPQGSTWMLEDLGSRNGTFVNGDRVTQAVSLQVGDRVEIGHTLLQAESAGGSGQAGSAGTCPLCGQQAGAGARFCRHCGGTLP